MAGNARNLWGVVFTPVTRVATLMRLATVQRLRFIVPLHEKQNDLDAENATRVTKRPAGVGNEVARLLAKFKVIRHDRKYAS